MARVTGLVVGAAMIFVTTGVFADSFDGKWTGEMDCAKLSFTNGAMKVPFELSVTGAMVTYSRQISNPDGSEFVGIEEGTGIVSGDGTIKLKSVAKAASRKLNFTGAYAGKLTAASGSLTGTQTWSSANGSEDRDCTITIQR